MANFVETMADLPCVAVTNDSAENADKMSRSVEGDKKHRPPTVPYQLREGKGGRPAHVVGDEALQPRFWRYGQKNRACRE